MHGAELAGEIRRLARERNAVILAHNYQRYEVQQAADLVGDSLGLSARAAATDAAVIVFCGVHFMAESAKILAPEKKVLMPRPDAGCPLANTITVEKLRALQGKHPGAPTVCYINSAAAIKAEVDVCCTSANMDKVVASLPDRTVLFVPDGNMGRYLQTILPEKEIVTWPGVCPTHHRLTAEQVRGQKRLHPGAKFIAHPECRLEVLELADAIRSTTGFLRYARESDAGEFIVGTEVGLIPRLEAENPGKRFYPASEQMVCPNMKMTTLEDLHEVLRREPADHEIEVPEAVRARAARALERMLAIGS